jgi:hypothetical protein
MLRDATGHADTVADVMIGLMETVEPVLATSGVNTSGVKRGASRPVGSGDKKKRKERSCRICVLNCGNNATQCKGRAAKGKCEYYEQ